MSDVITLLKQVDLFRGLATEQLKQLGAISSVEAFARGDTIFRQGDVADKLYVVGNGQVEVIAEHSDGHSESLVYLGVGQVVGEMTLVDEGRRSASVVAVEDDTIVYSIPNADLQNLFRDHTDIGYLIMRNIAQDMSFKLRHRSY